MPSGFWFEIHDQLRRDLAHVGNMAADVEVKYRTRRTVSANAADELSSLGADLKRLMGHS